MSNEIIVRNEAAAIDDVKRLMNIVLSLRQDVMKKDVDYGVIPGTGDKPVLLLPGMEKLMRALRLRPEYVLLSSKEDFEKPLFYYRYECRMIEVDSGKVVSAAIGSANSYEGKWRYRNAARICPTCGKETIIKGKAEYGGGWLCFAKKGGCGAKFREGDPQIEGQNVGRIVNEDIFDQINTIDKIAQKRALGSAIKGAANVSELFTVDIEDMQRYDIVDAVYEEVDTRHIDTSTGEIKNDPQPPANPVLDAAKERGGTVTKREDKPDALDKAWTEDEAKEFAARWQRQSLSQADLFAALGVTKALGEWKKSRKAADAAVDAWLLDRINEPVAS